MADKRSLSCRIISSVVWIQRTWLVYMGLRSIEISMGLRAIEISGFKSTNERICGSGCVYYLHDATQRPFYYVKIKETFLLCLLRVIKLKRQYYSLLCARKLYAFKKYIRVSLSSTPSTTYTYGSRSTLCRWLAGKYRLVVSENTRIRVDEQEFLKT